MTIAPALASGQQSLNQEVISSSVAFLKFREMPHKKLQMSFIYVLAEIVGHIFVKAIIIERKGAKRRMNQNSILKYALITWMADIQ